MHAHYARAYYYNNFFAVLSQPNYGGFQEKLFFDFIPPFLFAFLFPLFAFDA